jgi:hypothetical protein
MMYSNQQPTSHPNDPLAGYAAMIHQILAALRIDADGARLEVEGGYGWNFRYGSAIIEVYIHQNNEGAYFQVLSPIVTLPQASLLPLYRHLLELNLQLTNAALGVFSDTVYVFSERPLQGLDQVEAETTIQQVVNYADTLDDKLVSEFGGRLYNRA